MIAETRPTQRTRSRVSNQLVWVAVINSAITALNIVVGLLIARHYSTADYGRLLYFVNIFGLLRLMVAFGMNGQINYDVARAQTREEAGERFVALLGVRLVTLAGAALPLIGIGLARHDWLLLFAGVIALIALLGDFGIGTLQGLGETRLVLRMLALQPLVYAVGTWYLVTQDAPIHLVYIVFGLSFLLAISVPATTIPSALPVKRLRFLGVAVTSLRFAGGMYVLAIGGTIFTALATVVLGASGRFNDAALITIPLNLAFTPGALVYIALTTAYLPRLTRMHAAGQHDQVRSFFASSYGIISAAAVFFGGVLIAYPQVVLSLLYHDRYLSAAPLLRVLGLLAIAYTLQMVLTVTLIAQERLRHAVISTWASVILLIASLWMLLVPNGTWWLSVAHAGAALAGLIWQAWLIRGLMIRVIWQSAVYLSIVTIMLGVARYLVPDQPDHPGGALVMLAAMSMFYSVLVWRQATRASIPTVG